MKKLLLLILCCLSAMAGFAQDNKNASYVSTNDIVLFFRDRIMASMGKNTMYINVDMTQIRLIYKDVYTEESSQYADCLLWCAMICQNAGDNSQAGRLMKRSREIFKKYGQGPFDGRDTIQEIFYNDLLTNLLYNGDDYVGAIKHAEKSSELKCAYFGSTSEIYLKSLLDISKLYTERMKFKKAWYYHNLGYNAYVDMIKKEFCEKSESERVNYWYSVKSYIDKTINIAHESAYKMSSSSADSIAGAAYNALLLSKGLLLNTTLSFEDYVKNSKNTEACLNLEFKKEQASRGVSQAKLDSLDHVILDVLRESGQTFSIPHLSITWKDVRDALGSDDLAIEFYKNTAGDFGAVLIKRDWNAPKIVHLKEYVSYGRKSSMMLSRALDECSFESFSKTDTEKLWKLSKAVWTNEIVKWFPVTDEGRVYFAAEGELLVTGIEYFPFVKPECKGETVVEYHCLSDIYNIYRLTSTRMLATKSNRYTGTSAAVFGGLNYGMETEEMLVDNEKYTKHDSGEILYAFNSDKRDVRDIEEGIPELIGTEREADSIVSIINNTNKRNLTAEAYMSDEGTEAAFKALGGQNERLIHVASHGFFYNTADSLLIKKLELGENPLSHSGLIFAGADNKWFGDSIPDNVEDGFLTALEISSLDFRGLDLVVLSACETAKGYVTGDGVFGLQRGFKMAGTNSILMSLWKVDDDATCMLMTEFYRQWIGGKSKHDALELAKNKVRANKRWSEPQYWAAFILLDGIE